MKKLFYNGEVITADKTNSVHQAIMIEDEKISFVGSTQKALKYLETAPIPTVIKAAE